MPGAGQFRGLGRYVLVAATIPPGDATIVLRHGGSKGLANAMRGGTGAAMALIASLLPTG